MIGILGLVCHAFGHGGEMGEIGSGRVCLDAHSSLFRPCDWAIVFDIEQYPGIESGMLFHASDTLTALRFLFLS